MKKSIFALILLTCFILVSSISTVFIITHADHEHDHDGVGGSRATCAQLHNAENVLERLSTVALITAYMIVGLFTLKAIAYAFSGTADTHTPVALKIRMNN